MITSVFQDVKKVADTYATRNPFTNVFGTARSLVAFGMLLTLLFNDTKTLFIRSAMSQGQDTFLGQMNLFRLFDFDSIYLSVIIAIVILTWVIIGYLPQMTCILHWWVCMSFFQFIPIVDGGDQLTCIVTFLLIPICILDPRRNHWYAAPEVSMRNEYITMFCNCLVLIVKIQMAILYLQAGAEKIGVSEWADGTALYYWFNHNIFGSPYWLRQFFNPLLANPVFVSSLTWGTIAFEFVLFATIFMSHKRKRQMFWLAILFHFLILMVLGLISFFFSMAGALMLYLLPIEKGIDFKKFKINFYALGRA